MPIQMPGGNIEAAARNIRGNMGTVDRWAGVRRTIEEYHTSVVERDVAVGVLLPGSKFDKNGNAVQPDGKGSISLLEILIKLDEIKAQKE